MASRCVLLYSVAGGLINLECRGRWCLSHSLCMMYVSLQYWYVCIYSYGRCDFSGRSIRALTTMSTNAARG